MSEQITELWTDYLSGELGINQLCEKHQISRSKFYRMVKAKKLEDNTFLGKPRKLQKKDVVEVVKKWNQGESQLQIARDFNVTQALISQIINRKLHQKITQSMNIRDHTSKDVALVSVIYRPL